MEGNERKNGGLKITKIFKRRQKLFKYGVINLKGIRYRIKMDKYFRYNLSLQSQRPSFSVFYFSLNFGEQNLISI